MDFAKPFDNVKHSILSDKLNALNLHPYITTVKPVYNDPVYGGHPVYNGH